MEARLTAHPDKLQSLHAMEQTGGEPDVIGRDDQTDTILIADCSPQSPQGRRSLCYDHAAQESRKTARPKDNAIDMATTMGITLLTEAQYRTLQTLEDLDTKTSSWIHTPPEIRKLGGALFMDRRYNTVFVYHNGAQSWYSVRGFRGVLKL